MTTPNPEAEASFATATDLQPDATDAMAANESGLSAGDMLAQPTDYAGLPQPIQSSRCNVGRTEQKIRIGAGAALVAAAAFAPLSRGWRIALGALGAAELITGTTRYCPASQALGINTCRADER